MIFVNNRADIVEKNEIREIMRDRRDNLDSKSRLAASLKVTENLIKSQMFLNSSLISCYLSTDGELDTKFIIEEIWSSKKHCYLPVVHPSQYGQMCFIEYLPQSELVTNRFGIKEPLFEEDKIIDARDLDLVIVPVFAFDKECRRVGSGGGYYDRAFEFLKKESQKPILCGIAYDFQQVPEIISENFDISLNAVVTETKIIYCDTES